MLYSSNMLITTASLSCGVGILVVESEDDALKSPNLESQSSKRCNFRMVLYCVCLISFHVCLLLNNFAMMTLFAVPTENQIQTDWGTTDFTLIECNHYPTG